MRHRLLFSAACVVVGALCMPLYGQYGDSGNNVTGSPATQPGMTADRASSADQMAPDAKDIRGMLKDATEAGVKKNGFDNLVRRFVDADRDRISKSDKSVTKDDWNKLNGRIEQFHKDWKAKYNQDFDIDHPEMVFNDTFRIIQGKIGDAQPAGARMGDNTAGNTGNMDKSAPDTTPGPQSDKVAGGDVNREPGRKVAKVTFPASHGLPMLYIPLIREVPDAWKIDVPDSVDARKLYDNLLNHVTMIDEHKDQWPSDVNDAYRLVSHHILMGVMDQNENSSDMNRGDNMPRTGTGTGTDTGTGTGR